METLEQRVANLERLVVMLLAEHHLGNSTTRTAGHVLHEILRAAPQQIEQLTEQPADHPQ